MNSDIFSNFLIIGLPIVILIMVGFLSHRLLLKNKSIWAEVDRVNYILLIPALIVGTLIQTDIYAISGLLIMGTVLLVLAGLTITLYFAYSRFVPSSIDKPAFTSVFQTSTRWNASLAIVVAELLFDSYAITVIALIMIVLMPIVNVVNITMMVRLLQSQGASPSGTLKTVAKNPIIIGCAIGIALSALRVPVPVPVAKTFDIISNSTIGMILLSLGAGLTMSGFKDRALPIALSCFFKLVLMPALFFSIGFSFHLDSSLLVVATVATAMPTATNGYVVAKNMGGDAPLYASICTIQTLMSFITVPLWILLCLSFQQ